MTGRPARLVHDDDGLNSGVWPIPTGLLITPVESFFTRSHAAVPRLDRQAWRLEIDGMVKRPASFSLEHLEKTFARREVVATLVCAGLRRVEFLSMGELPGELPWGPEPASTGIWEGVSLSDVLESVGVLDGATHVELTGLDQVERNAIRFGFGGSIDLTKAVSGEVILATTLNGEPLKPEHGFPLRALVPGWIGARSIKWLGRISLQSEPSRNYFQSEAYRIQRVADPGKPRDVSSGGALAEVPLNAVIIEPVDLAVLPAGRTYVRGWAMGFGGSEVTAVELSADNGVQWTRARVSIKGSAWTWTFWEAELDLPPGTHYLSVRATDVSGACQPSTSDATWNVKGYANNAWHRVTIRTA